jgi:uncharacterized protein YndB with AHSA1/START domain
MTRTVSRSVHVAAPPSAVFDLLADARRHTEIDGSGTVKGDVKAPPRLHYGARFRMRMNVGVPYLITNTVVEFAEDRLIAWRHFGRHVWRYELEPEGEGTRVTETFDWNRALAPRFIELAGFPDKNLSAIEATLERLQGRFAPSVG